MRSFLTTNLKNSSFFGTCTQKMDYHLLEHEQLQALTPRYVAMKVVTVKPDQKHLLSISSVALLNLYRGDHKGSLCHILV